LNDFIKR